MNKQFLSIKKLNPLEQQWFLSDTQCECCGAVDVGIDNPVYFRENGVEYIEGTCKVCDELQITKVEVCKLTEDRILM